MKLLIIASLSETATAKYFLTAFRKSGHDLLVCSDIPGSEVDRVVSGVIDVAALLHFHRFDADAMIFFEGGSMRLLPDTTTCPDLVTIWYAIDTHMDFAKHVRIGRLFDRTFVAQQEYVENLTAGGVLEAEWLPLAFAPDILPQDQPSRDIDIAYVGSDNASLHPVRSAMLAALAEAFPAHRFGRAMPNEMGEIYSRAKIVFNRAVNNDVNMRVFEAMGSGAVLLTDQIVDNGMEVLFEEGTHYLTYRDRDHLLTIANNLLADAAQLRTIGEAARACVLEHHTYQHRADQMVAKLANTEKSVNPQAPDLFAACIALGLGSGALMSAARSLEGLGGGQLQRRVGAIAAGWVRLAATFVATLERLRSIVDNAYRA
jgi:hypothetical protein